ncbi:leucine-rich repeat and IQ domain-containing protein 1 isoform X2 [Denticeps clupeoides]|uniref:Leucine-rich repeat and IQ domain-containing protein 1 n=1 Tax=Denticeps clupeoides TaxID=299321 RepID=A0AAY4C9V6_9TELE|nr:leucine-rich repeat and IQ domain-containing protein 1 isoform X2 [Denticeps clupeoides]
MAGSPRTRSDTELSSTSEDEKSHLPDDKGDENEAGEDVPEPVQHSETPSSRAGDFENPSQEDISENDFLMDLASYPSEDMKAELMKTKNEDDMPPYRHGAAEISTSPLHENEDFQSAEYLEYEARLSLELEALERRLEEEEHQKRAECEAERERLLSPNGEEDERRRHNCRLFEEELRKIQLTSLFLNTDTKENFKLELMEQQELIRKLEQQVEKEKREYEMVQQEQARKQQVQRCGAATKIQAAFRAFLTRQWTKAMLSKRREEKQRQEEERREMDEKRKRQERLQEAEMERKKKAEEERFQREEQDKRLAEYERAKHEEHLRLIEENKREEERKVMERRRREVEQPKKGKEEQERKILDKELNKIKNEEDTKHIQERRKKDEESEKKEEWVTKMSEEDDRKTKEKEEMKTNERTLKEQETKRKEGEEKKKEEKEEEAKRKYEEDGMMREQIREQKVKEERKIEDERKIIDEEDAKMREQEIKRKKEERKREDEHVEVTHMRGKSKEEEEEQIVEAVRKTEHEEDRNMREQGGKGKEEDVRNRESRKSENVENMTEKDRKRKEEEERKRKHWDDQVKEQESKYKVEEEGRKRMEIVKNRNEDRDTQIIEKVRKEKHEEGGKQMEEIAMMEEIEKDRIVDVQEGNHKEEENLPAYRKKKDKEGNRGEEEDSRKEKTEEEGLLERAEDEKGEERKHCSIAQDNKQLTSCLGRDQSQDTTGLYHDSSLIKEGQSQTKGRNQHQAVGERVDHTSVVHAVGSMYLPDSTEQKRLTWMLGCTSWSRLSMQNRRRTPAETRQKRGSRRPPEPSLPPLSVTTVLNSGPWDGLSQVTTVTLEDVPGCSLSTLSECSRLQSLTLRCCGLRALEGLSQCRELKYIDVQENSISYVDCENLTALHVLKLGRNQLTTIHGLNGAANLVELQLSYNHISSVSGLEYLKKLQSLWIDHNYITNTRDLKTLFTLLDLDCAHNHLTSAEGLNNCALLRTLRLAGNTLTEAPCLSNNVLLGELSLDNNSISSLEGLANCWLPLLHTLNLAQNSLTQLPLLCDFISLMTLDVSHNGLSELPNICESVHKCSQLREINLTGNPLLQEPNWRTSLLEAVPGLMLVNGQSAEPLLPPADPAPEGSVQAMCQVQWQQLLSLQQTHHTEISSCPSLLEAHHHLFSRHSKELFQLAEEHRYAHEYGDASVTQRRHQQTLPPEACSQNSRLRDTPITLPIQEPSIQTGPTSDGPPCSPAGSHLTCSAFSEELDPPSPSTLSPAQIPVRQKAPWSKSSSSPGSRHRTLDLRNIAAAVIQQHWCRHRSRKSASPAVTAPKADGKCCVLEDAKTGALMPEPRDRDSAATVIQAMWRGFALRKRLSLALAAAQIEERVDAFEEVDVDEFYFDEPLHREPELLWKPKQAWSSSETAASPEPRINPDTNRTMSPALMAAQGFLSERSEKILQEWGITDSHTALLILKRARKLKPRKQKKLLDPDVRLALFQSHCGQSVPPGGTERREIFQARQAEQEAGGEARAERRGSYAQADQSDWSSAATRPSPLSPSERFLPEMDSAVLRGGRVQLVAVPSSRHLPDPSMGLWPGAAEVPQKGNTPVRRNSAEHPRNEAPPPTRIPSEPLRKERLSFRDNPVQTSGGWGGGKKRDKVFK